MKKIFAIMLVAVFAVTFSSAALAQYVFPGPGAPFANDPYYSNTDSRGDVYWGLSNWIKDRVHGQPGNPNKEFEYEVGTGSATWDKNGLIQFDQYGDFMWQSGQLLQRPNPVDQYDLMEDRCKWYDYPEYVGCTEYFYLFVYEPLCITCVCEDYRCIGIFTIPSYHDLYPQGANPFLQGNQFSCTWNIRGQVGWFVVLSGEIIYVPPVPGGGGVLIDWKWYGQQAPLLGGFTALPTSFFEDNDNWHKLIQLSNPGGLYFVGLAAQSVAVAPNADPGVHSWEATVSGFYYF